MFDLEANIIKYTFLIREIESYTKTLLDIF